MRDEGFIYVAGHPLLNRRCTRLPGCIRLRNDLYCVEWGIKLYSLTLKNHANTTLYLYTQHNLTLSIIDSIQRVLFTSPRADQSET